MKRAIVLLAALTGLAACAQTSVIPPEGRRYQPYTGLIPACDDGSALARITDRFQQKEAGYWSSDKQIVGYSQIREIGFLANGASYIPRRYCIARATLNDNSQHTVVYQIQENLGMIGWGFGVEWCVVGYDRNFADAPACSALRPFAERYLAEHGLKERY